VRRKLAV